jgi:hypothetical protein
MDLIIKNLSSDEVISETISFYRKNFWFLIIFSLIITILSQSLAYIGKYYTVLEQIRNMTDTRTILSLSLQLIPLLTIILVISIISQTLLLSFIIQRLKGDESHFIDIFRTALRKYFLKILLASILTSIIFLIGTIVGLIVFIIGILFTFIYFLTVIIVTFPIIIAEDKSVFSSIRRSFNLIHKDFWGAIGAVCLFILMILVIYIIALIFKLIPFTILFVNELIKGETFFSILHNTQLFENNSIASAITNIIFSIILLPMSSIFSVFLYIKVKNKENQKQTELSIIENNQSKLIQ